MRIATLIIALCLSLAVGLQSCTIYGASHIAQDEKLVGGGAIGIVIALLFVIGAAFVMGLPRVSAGLFAVAALLAFMAAGSTEFSDMWIWGGVSCALAVMSWLGGREARRRPEGSPALQFPDSQTGARPQSAESPRPVTVSAAPVRSDPIGEIERLARLRAAGDLSATEFNELKSKLLTRS